MDSNSNLLQSTKQSRMLEERQCGWVENRLMNTNPLLQQLNWPSLTSEVKGESLINLS